MAKWQRVWLKASAIFLSLHWLGDRVFGMGHDAPYDTPSALVFGAFGFGGIMAWLLSAGDRAKPPDDPYDR